MEPLKLPFPSLQFLAAHAIGHCLVLMKLDEAYWCTNLPDSRREWELRVDKLPLRPAPREYVRNVLWGFFVQVYEWIYPKNLNPGAVILVDARGNIDESRMARHHFEKLYKDGFYREDFQPLAHFLEHVFWYHPEYKDFVSFIAALQEIYTFPEKPEYQLVRGDLHVVFRFVNRHRVSSAFNPLLRLKGDLLEVSMEQKDVLLTFKVSNERHYDEEMFKMHLHLLQPLQRLEFAKHVLHEKMAARFVQKVLCLLNLLDSDARRDSILCLNADELHRRAFMFLECWLTPGYEGHFIPMLKLVGLNLDSWMYLDFFRSLVDKIRLIGFEDLPSQFWQLLSARQKSSFLNALEQSDFDPFHNWIKHAMKRLSQTNMALFQVVFDDVSASLPKEQARGLLRETLNE